jgi:dipeptidyl-peptidase 4
MKKTLGVVIAVCCAMAAWAGEVPDTTLLTIDRLFASGEFSGGFGAGGKWTPAGDAYTAVEGSFHTGREIIRYDAMTGERSVLASAAQLTPEGMIRPLAVENYSWSPDASHLLIFTNSKRVWRQNTRGDFWVLDLAKGGLRKLGGNAPPSSLMFAEFSPDGKRVAYVVENNLKVEDLASGKITPITTDGSVTTINGTFDWMYEEEFDCRQGFVWSPDSKSLAYWHIDASGVGDYFLLNTTDSIYSRVIPVQYPKAGTTISACRIGVASADGGKTTWVKAPGDPRATYIPRVQWSPDARAVVFQQLNRIQDTLRLFSADPGTGNVSLLRLETDSAWVDVVDDMKWVEGGKGFIWVTEADGWRHVIVCNVKDGSTRALTPGAFDVTDVAAVTDSLLYFRASPTSPVRRFLYCANLTGAPRVHRVTPPELVGTHSYVIAPKGHLAFHSFSSMNVPSMTEIVTLPGHKPVRTVRDNARILNKVAALRPTLSSYFRVAADDGTMLDGWKILPADFDSTKKYPLLIYVYGEPAEQTVADRWGGTYYLWHRMLAQRGYIVVSIDNRGTPAPRGRAWRKCIYQKIGLLAPQDQAAALRVIRRWPYVDSTRVGYWGWSGGGSMTLNMLFRYPELVKVGVAVAPVPDQRLYDAAYQERYMGLPSDSGGAYTQGSPLTFAGNLQGDLLVIHGTGDDNVHFQGTERLINALIKANKQFSMMAYPNRSHGIFEGENTTRHLFTLITNYLHHHLPEGPR